MQNQIQRQNGIQMEDQIQTQTQNRPEPYAKLGRDIVPPV